MTRAQKKVAARKRASDWYCANREWAKRRISAWQKANPDKVKDNRIKHKKAIHAGQRRCYKKRRQYYIKRAARWAENNPTRRRMIARASHIRIKYGLPKSDYLRMLTACEGRCPICLNAFQSSGAHMESVDHNHQTGKVRGLICRLCNSGLGMFKDSSATLRRAVNYLK